MYRDSGVRQRYGDHFAAGRSTPDFDGSITLQNRVILKQRVHLPAGDVTAAAAPEGRRLRLPSHTEAHRP